jgi:hypothetical protein
MMLSGCSERSVAENPSSGAEIIGRKRLMEKVERKLRESGLERPAEQLY